jgi:hypothetical protein
LDSFIAATAESLAATQLNLVLLENESPVGISYNQQNTALSRKFVLPALQDFFKSLPSRSPSSQ